MKKLLLVCALVIGVSAVSLAQGGGRRTPKEQTDQLKEKVAGVTDDQAAKITMIFTKCTTRSSSSVPMAFSLNISIVIASQNAIRSSKSSCMF